MSALFTAAVATPGRAENPGQQAEGGAETSGLILKNFETGAAISVPRHFASASDMHEIRRRIHRQDVQARWTPSPENISVNLSTLRYSLPSYPPLAFMVNERDWRSILAFTVIGALALAAFSQASFYFPCTTGMSTVSWRGTDYCVPTDALSRVTPTSCPADICAARVPVTLQTYGVLLNGLLAGRYGVAATALYVLLVNLGAPFGAGARVDPIWLRGASAGSTGGYFFGFLAATWLMGVCAEKGHDRARSMHRLAAWLFAAQAVIYVCGLFWLPFGLAIRRNVSPSVICPDFSTPSGAARCLSNLAQWGLLPFLPGDLLKLAMVVFTVPLAWRLMLAWTAWRSSAQPVPTPTTSASTSRGSGSEGEDDSSGPSAVQEYA